MTPGAGGCRDLAVLTRATRWCSRSNIRRCSTAIMPVLKAPNTHRHGIAESMGRVVAGGDSAAMESLWSLLQTNIHN